MPVLPLKNDFPLSCHGVVDVTSTDVTSRHAVRAQVVTIARAPARSERLLSQLSSQGINHEVFHGVDGLEDIPSSLMEVYGGKQTLQALRDGHRRFLGKDHWVGMAERRANGTLPSDKRKGSLFLRMQLAAKLSFLSVFHKMVSRRWEYMLVFEDDAGLVPDFAGKLREALCKLPDNFDVLYLSACLETTGPAIRPGIVQYRGGSCTLGFVASLPFVLRTLHKESFRLQDDPFDHVAMKQASYGRSFITDPKLLTFPVGIESELRG